MKMITKYMRKWSPWNKVPGKDFEQGRNAEHIQSTAYFH